MESLLLVYICLFFSGCLVSSEKNYPISCLGGVCWGMANKLGCQNSKSWGDSGDGETHGKTSMISPSSPVLVDVLQLWLACLSLELVGFSLSVNCQQRDKESLVSLARGVLGRGI